ncbi:MAG: 4-(cytidine 5'-diphospho)-2-C-methyl-D-erythritol kinase [Calditrichaeota bacterium]|nr:4-(cytidine 5'-diphospho)-2-C-methyl-D-erythritol kinase [Calditrichota bacterium]
MDLIKIKSNAKINLGLEIVGKRNNGYHNLRSIFQEIDLADEITIKKTDTHSIKLTCSNPDLPTDNRNTAYRAAEFLLDRISGVDIHIEKKIPHEAGLGGGSSNAAATLLGINQLFKLNMDDTELMKFAELIGSDVTFFIFGKQALVSGVGNILKAIHFPFNYPIVLLKPDVSFSTREIYQNYQKFLGKHKEIDFDSFFRNPVAESYHLLRNDLEKAVSKPIITYLKKYLSSQGAFYSAMTGSGSVVYGLFQKKPDLHDLPDDVNVFFSRGITD